jgi:diacylglycerol O-acyltransferase 2, plant
VQVYALAASAVFMLPLYKHLMTWVGAAPASRKNLAKLLNMGSVAVIVGGIAEMFMVRKDSEDILLRGRKGLMRTAIETGTPIVPVYFLGGSQTLSFGPTCLKALSRRLRTSIGFVFGRMGLPIPRQITIHMVSGKLIWPGDALHCGV